MRTRLLLTTVALIGLLFYLAYASTGQIKGRITDRQTGEPVIGASVSIVGTPMGARTDVDGRYQILRVEPGVYSLRISHIDYSICTLDSVVVDEGRTCENNIALDRSTTELSKTIEVQAEPELIEPFVTGGRTTISDEAIKTRPPQTVDALLSQVSGVRTKTTGDVLIRGGRAGEVTYIVDGMEIGDPLRDLGEAGEDCAMAPGSPYPAHGGSAIVNNEPYDAMFFENHGVNPFVDTEDDHLSTFASDVDDASFVLARSYLQRGHLPNKDAVRIEEFVNHFSYDYPLPQREAFGVLVEGAPSRFGPANTILLRIGIKGREITEAERKPANLIFVVDISGSMAGGGRLGLVQQSLRLLVQRLRSDDRIGIVVYGSVGQVRVEPTEVRNRSKILDVINQLRPGGSTNAEHGLLLGYEMANRSFDPTRINRIILCSDGVANVGRTGPDQILRAIDRYRQRGITLTTIGFGMGNYNDALMERLADGGDGVYAYVDDIVDARKLLVDNLAGTLEMIAKDVKIQVDFNPRTVRSYRLLGYENRDVADAKFRDDAEDGGEIGAGHSTTALYELKLHREPKDDLVATVFVRYKSTDAEETVNEVNHRILRQVFTDQFARTSTDFRLAAAAAEFAEILRHSYWARDAKLSDVFRLARSIADERSYPEAEEFVGLVSRAIELQELSTNQ